MEANDNGGKDCLINDFDLEILGEGFDLEQYDSFKVENMLYNLKKDIKVDPSDFG